MKNPFTFKRATLVKTENGLVIESMLKNSLLSEDTLFSSALTCTHDLLEHVNGVSKIGTIRDELEAFGAIVLGRGTWGSGEIGTPTQIMREIIGFCHYARPSLIVEKVKCGKYHDNFKSSHLRGFFDGLSFSTDTLLEVAIGEEYEDFEQALTCNDEFAQALRCYIVTHLDRGVKKAQNRYGENGLFLYDCFNSLHYELSKADKRLDEGRRLVVRSSSCYDYHFKVNTLGERYL